MQFAFMYFVCVYPGCKMLLPKIVACEGRKERQQQRVVFIKQQCRKGYSTQLSELETKQPDTRANVVGRATKCTPLNH